MKPGAMEHQTVVAARLHTECTMAAIEYFGIASPVDRDTFLSITDDVLQTSLLILAPFGLPRQLKKAVGSEDLFITKYGPRFRFILEAVSEVVYARRGVSESEVAVSLHKYAEEDEDPEAQAHLGRMSEALRLMYSPPRMLELPRVLSMNELVSLGLTMLRKGSIYARQQSLSDDERSESDLPCGAVNTESPRAREQSLAGRGAYVDNECSRCVACEARQATARYARRLRENVDISARREAQCADWDSAGEIATKTKDLAEDGDSGTCSRRTESRVRDHDKARRGMVGSCLSAMFDVRKEQEAFSDDFQQAHIQALTEACAAKYSGGSSIVSHACTSSTSNDSPTREQSSLSALAALDEISAVAFMDNELFVLIRALEERSGAETEPGNAGVHLPSGRVCDDADSFLDSILTSQAYRALAEQRLEKGLTQEAAKCFEEAYEQGSDCLPRRCLAEVLAGRAKCDLSTGDLEAASSQAERAFAIHKGCADAFLVRGQCRRELGDEDGALRDLVNAFVLRGTALNGAADGREAQAIEEVSREACKARAGETFSTRQATDTLPADWVVRSFLASYDMEGLYTELDIKMRSPEPDADERSPEETALWQGVSYLKEGRYTESMASFSAALESNDAKLRSLALEQHGSFQYLTGDMHGSLESLRLSAESDSSNVKSWVKKGSILNDLGRRDEAFECFEAAEAIDPLESDIFLHRGQGFLLDNNFRKATADLEKSVELCPVMPVSWAAWGIALFKLGTTNEQPSPSSVRKCLQVMEDALERFPGSLEVLLFFAEVLISIGNFARGLELLKRSASLDPECPLPYVNGARAYLGMNDLVAARRHLDFGQELDPSYAGTFMDMGQLLMQEGKPADALAMYGRGVETARFPSEVHDAMACLDVAKCHLEAQELLHQEATL